MSELTVIEIKPDQAPALYVPNGLDAYLEQIRQLSQEVPDVTTKKGRDRIGSLARAVGSSKKAIEDPGRAYLKHLKEAVKPAEEELRRFTRECDGIRDSILKPRDDWEAEQERLKQEEEARLAAEAYSLMRDEADSMNAAFDVARAEALRKKIETDHEMALLMNDAFDRDREEQRRLAEQAQRERDEKLQRDAAEKATRDAEEKTKRERQQHQDALSEISGIQQQTIIAQSGRLGVRQGGTIQCIKDTLAETEAWPIDDRFGSLLGAAENAKKQAISHIKQLLINAEAIQKQHEEEERIKREAEQKEAARLAEDKRIADEKAKREADVKHRKAIGTDIVNALTANTSISREQAIEVLTAMMNGLVPHSNINY